MKRSKEIAIGIPIIIVVLLGLRFAIVKSTVPRTKGFDEALMKELLSQMEPALAEMKPLVKFIGDRDYEAAYDGLDAKLQNVWEKEDFVSSVGDIRDRIGDKWSPFMFTSEINHTRIGTVLSLGYQLDGVVRCGTESIEYALMIKALKTKQDCKVINWVMGRPCDEKDDSATAEKVASAFLAHWRNERYADAQNFIAPEVRSRLDETALRQMWKLAWAGGNELHVKPCRIKIVNGTSYYSVVALPLESGTFAEIHLTGSGAEMKVAGLAARAWRGK
ncbi:MAG: hypothetical protein HQ592_12455 [Planctomycetes bacterium]|nr:hypothetical protein [Planctomycetota bacterium]